MTKSVTPEQLEIEIMKDLTGLFRGISVESSNLMIDLAPVSTGALKASINAAVDSEDDSFDPNNTDPTGESTKARNENAISSAKIGQTVAIVVGAPYGAKVEGGSSEEAPSGFVKVTGESLGAIIDRAISDIPKYRDK